MASSDVQTIQKPKNHPEQYRNTPELTQPPRLYSTHGKQEIPPTNGWLGGTTHPIPLHTSMQSIPWPPSYSLTTTTSILDLPWASPTWHLQGWPASTCLRPNVLELSRHAQGCPDSSSYVWLLPGMSRPPRNHPEQYRNPWNAWKTWKSPDILENHPEHPVHRAGAAIMAHTYPLICGTCMLPHHP